MRSKNAADAPSLLIAQMIAMMVVLAIGGGFTLPVQAQSNQTDESNESSVVERVAAEPETTNNAEGMTAEGTPNETDIDPAADPMYAAAWLDRLALARGVNADEIRRAFDPGMATLEALTQDITQAIRDQPAPAGTGQARRAAAAELQERRQRLAEVTYLKADLCRRAALAAQTSLQTSDPSTASAEALAQLAESMAAQATAYAQTLRFDFRQLTFSVLGYVVESRLQREAGNPDAARTTLSPAFDALDLDPNTDRLNSDADPRIITTIMVESLELSLAGDPNLALARMQRLGDRPNLPEGLLDWTRWAQARALVAGAGRTDPERWTHFREAWQQSSTVASPLERWLLAASAEHAGAGIVLANEDRRALSDQWLSLRRPDDAVAMWQQFAAIGGEIGAADALAFGHAALSAGERDLARKHLELAVAQMSEDDPAHVIALQRLTQLQGDASNPADLAALVNSDADAARRRVALERLIQSLIQGLNQDSNQLATDQNQTQSQAQVEAQRARDILSANQDLVDQSPWLIYVQTQLIDPPASAPIWANVEERLNAFASADAESTEPLGRLARLQRVRSLQRANDPSAALALLEDQWTALVADPVTAAVAHPLRLDLLLSFGAIQSTLDALASWPSDLPVSHDQSLRAGAVFAVGYAEQSSDGQVAIRETMQNMAEAVITRGAAPEVEVRLAEHLAAVEANALAARITQRLIVLDSRLPAVSRARRLNLRLLLAQNELNEAQRGLEVALAAAPDDADLLELSAEFHERLGDSDIAMQQWRQARAAANPGSDAWWRCTLALAVMMTESGHESDARALLRSATILQPLPDSVQLQVKLRELQG